MPQPTLAPITLEPSEWDELVRLYEQPGPAFLERTLARQGAGRYPPRLAVLMIDRLARLGLGEAARALVPDEAVEDIEPDALHAALADVPPGTVPRSELERMLEANLAAFEGAA